MRRAHLGWRCIVSLVDVAQNWKLHVPDPWGASADLAIYRILGRARAPPREVLLPDELPTPGL
eukprot:4351671-Pyramimonas_sp.AAC.1